MAQLEALPHVVVTDTTDRHAIDAQRDVARRGHHRIPPVDVVIAAIGT